MTIDNRPKCYRCKYFCIEDYGYSDWTIEGTEIYCLKGFVEEMEQAYDHESENLKDQFGTLEAASMKCNSYKEGEPLEFNVEYDDKDKAKKDRLLE